MRHNITASWASLSKATLLAVVCCGAFARADVDPEVPATPIPPTVTLERNDKVIVVKKYGPDDAGFSVDCLPKDEDKDQITTSFFSDLPPYFVHVWVDKNIIRANVVVARKKQGGDGQLEAYNGTVMQIETGDDEEKCAFVAKPDPKPGTVFVEQGKTKLTGSKLDYTEETGIAVIQGPIVFERPQDKGDTLRGAAQKITVDVDNEKTFLEGQVTLRSKCRTSSADKVEYDDRKNRAILFGKPAVSSSVDGKDTIKGERLEYDLDTNDVVVTAAGDGVTGQFEDDAAPCR